MKTSIFLHLYLAWPNRHEFIYEFFINRLQVKLKTFITKLHNKIICYLIHYFCSISDLSFNNIEVIEGLDKLTKLKDLTLYNNRISKLENMESLTQLHVFSIGNNSLKQLDNVSNCTVNWWEGEGGTGVEGYEAPTSHTFFPWYIPHLSSVVSFSSPELLVPLSRVGLCTRNKWLWVQMI